MPIVSKYSNEQVENISQKLMDLLVEEKISPDLALMCLGNTITSIINGQIAEKDRAKLVTNFAAALKNSIQ